MLKKARQQRHNRKAKFTTIIFQRKIGCLRWDSNPRPSAFQAMLLPTELPRQLSWLGQILHTNYKAFQPDEQVNVHVAWRLNIELYFGRLLLKQLSCACFFDFMCSLGKLAQLMRVSLPTNVQECTCTMRVLWVHKKPDVGCYRHIL